jgi:O-methyltransferase
LKKIIVDILGKAGLEIRASPKTENPLRNAETLFPVEASLFERELISKASKYSMTGIVRMWALIQAFKHVQENNILGDYVECGVWKGGNLILLSGLQESIGTNRTIYGFDTFSGMTNPTDHDVDYLGNFAGEMMQSETKIEGGNSIHCLASLALVENNLLEKGAKNIKLIEGDVAITLKDSKNLPEKIAILRLDTDWYESTKVELETLYPLLEPGGVLVIDDYGHFSGARKAVDEYFKGMEIWMHYVDYTCRLVIKK